MAYQNADTPDRVKAIGGVLVVHAALAALILSGLGVTRVARTVERLKTIVILQLPPAPPPRSAPQRARDREGAAARKALATPVVAPRIQLPVKPPVIAAAIPSTGSASTAGAAADGNGMGAGGAGNGLGGGGSGDYSGYTPAQMLNKIPNREYRRIANGSIPQGSAGIRFRVNPDGRMANCRITRSSGDPTVDWILCDVATRYLRFAPARDRDGRPIGQEVSYTPTWRPNY